MNTKEAVLAWFAGLAVLVGVLALLYFTLGQMYLTAEHNNHKVQNLIQTCVSEGYDGYIEDSSVHGQFTFRCYNKGE